MAQQRHEQVIDLLIVQIFNRELKPGEKLPTERELSKQFNVDRTSLRVALKQLQSMHLLDIRQGDGMYVKDYLDFAGLDFLDRLFLMDFTGVEERIIDGYIYDELWEFWIEFLPTMLTVAAKNFSTRHIKIGMGILEEEERNLHNPSKVIELELKSQEMVAKATNNIMFIMLTNATRQIRRKMLELFVKVVGIDTVKQHIQLKKDMMNALYTESAADILEAAGKYKEVLRQLRLKMRQIATSRKRKEDVIII